MWFFVAMYDFCFLIMNGEIRKNDIGWTTCAVLMERGLVRHDTSWGVKRKGKERSTGFRKHTKGQII